MLLNIVYVAIFRKIYNIIHNVRTTITCLVAGHAVGEKGERRTTIA